MQAQVVPLTIDSSQSSVIFNIGGTPGISQLSGDAAIDLASANPPAGDAQITDLNLVLDDQVTASFALGLLSGSTSPGDVTISLVTPGNPGAISGGSFAQLANSLALGGDLSVADPFGVAGGNQTIDLSAIDIAPVDFSSVSVTQAGNDITVSSSFSFTETLQLAGGPVTIIVNGTFVASGEVPVTVMRGDVNLDNAVNCLDISPFITILFTREFQAEADINQNQTVNFLDIFPFIGLLGDQ